MMPVINQQLQAEVVRVEAYIRTDFQGASDRITAVLDRLERLIDEDTVIGSVSVTSWTDPSQQSLTQTSTGSLTRPQRAVRATVAEFREWATQQGCSLAPAFDRPNAADNDDERLKAPIIGLAMYDADDDADADTGTSDDELLAVFPYTDRDGEVHTVEDCLDMLEGS